MSTKYKILVVEHDKADLDLLEYELDKGGINYISEIVQYEPDYVNALKDFIPDIILSDYSLPQFDGATAFKIRQDIAPNIPFIFVSGAIGEEISIEYIKNGVTDYVLKDKLFTLTSKIKRALLESEEEQQKNKTEQKLIQRERQLAKAQEVAQMGSWELDFTTNVLLFSDEACRIFGIPFHKNQLSFERLFSLVHPEDLNFVSQTIGESRNSLKDISYSYRIILIDGTVRHIYSESKFDFDPNYNPVGLYGTVHDVTEIKLAETERTKMIIDVMQKNRDLEQFAYIVSHNLRAPVANIIGTVNMLNEPGLDMEKKDMLSQKLGETVTRLDNIVKDLNVILEVKNQANDVKEVVYFDPLLTNIKNNLKSLIDKNNIEVQVDFSGVDHFFTIKSYLYSIFYNLIVNGIKYRQNFITCIIKIKSHLVKDKIELIFTDNGKGIALEKRGDQVFGLYKRFHTNVDGKGMGLFMVKMQVESLGGKISISSEIGKGTEFKIEFQL